MWFTKTTEGMQGWFALSDRTGQLAGGLVSGDFTVTYINPDDDASATATVTESNELAGLYTFLVPASFFSTHGTGVYIVVIVVDSSGPDPIRDVLSRPFRVSDNDFDTIGGNTVLIPALL